MSVNAVQVQATSGITSGFLPPPWILEPEIHDWLTVLVVMPLIFISVPALSILAMILLPVEPVVKVYIGALLLGANIVWPRFVIDG
jgi:hypothetical protein